MRHIDFILCAIIIGFATGVLVRSEESVCHWQRRVLVPGSERWPLVVYAPPGFGSRAHVPVARNAYETVRSQCVGPGEKTPEWIRPSSLPVPLYGPWEVDTE